MFPYQIYQALTDQRTHELVAAAERHRRLIEARYNSTDSNESPWRLRDLIARLAALLQVSKDAPRTTVASTSGAGPIGCSA